MTDGDRLTKELKPDIPRDVVALVVDRFLLQAPNGLFAPFASLGELRTEVSQVLSAFEANLHAAVSVGSMPFMFVERAQHDLMFSQFFTAESIRQLKDSPPDGGLTDQQREAARGIVQEKMAAPDQTRQMLETIVGALYRFLAHAPLGFLANELLRQTSVMIWGAIEVLATDLARHVLNRRPKLAANILASDPFKRHFSPKGIPIDVLEGYDFNVSKTMGEVVCDTRKIDDPASIYAVFQIIGGEVELSKKLKSETLWTLFQRRNLIVHRRGIVDILYVSKTGDNKTPVGEHVAVKSTDVDNYLLLARDIGLLMARSANQAIQPEQNSKI